MHARELLKSVVNGALRHLGLQIVRYRMPVEHEYFEVIRDAIANRESPLVVDVGAHIGGNLESYFLANRASRVLAIEPSPESYRHLVRLAEQWHPAVYCVNTAIGEENGRIPFHVYSESQTNSLLCPNEHAASDAPYLTKTQESLLVPVCRLDDVMDDRGLGDATVGFLKVDVQGTEDQVLRGAERTLQRTENILIEVNFNSVYEKSCLVDEVCWILRNRGFYLQRSIGFLPAQRSQRLLSSDFVFSRRDAS